MSYVLIVDDMAIVRELMDCGLRAAGYETACATNGLEALAAIQARVPDLMLLDMMMPVMGGLELLEHLRANPATAKLPVILLTASGDKDRIVRAARFGVQDYLLKSQFALKSLLSRVQKHIGSPKTAATPAPAPKSAAVAAPSAPPPTVPAPGDQKPEPIAPAVVAAPAATSPAGPAPALKREETIARIERYTASKTLAGVIAEIIAMAGSPRTSLGDLVGLLKRDAVICARVMQVANTALSSSGKPSVTSIEDAVRNIGLGGVRNIAAAIGFFDALPPDAADGFNAIRCWQHSFAAAAIMERVAPTSATFTSGMAYLIGLCHDLGEIVLRQCLAAEYSAALESAAQSGESLPKAMTSAFGVPPGELSRLVLNRMGLPSAISAPILEYADSSIDERQSPRSAAGQALRFADLYAHGLLLASSPRAMIAPMTANDLRTMGSPVLPEIDGPGLRCEVLSNTALLARLSRSDEQRLSKPLVAARPVRIWYARHPGYVKLDPIEAALGSLCTLQTHERLPVNAELEGCAAIVVAATRLGTAPFTIEAIAAATAPAGRPPVPVIYLTGQAASDPQSQPVPANVTQVEYPLSISRLASLIESFQTAAVSAAA